MTNTTLPTNPEATNLVAAGESFFKAMTGREMSDNQQKVSDGITKIVDGLLPSLEKMVTRFTLSDMLTGLTLSLNGATLMVKGAKTPNKPLEETTSNTPTSSIQTTIQ